MFYVYILLSTKNGRHYIGYSENALQRLAQHNNGLNHSTKNGRPWKIIYTETYGTKSEAWKREQQIKKYKGGRAFKELLNNNGRVA